MESTSANTAWSRTFFFPVVTCCGRGILDHPLFFSLIFVNILFFVFTFILIFCFVMVKCFGFVKPKPKQLHSHVWPKMLLLSSWGTLKLSVHWFAHFSLALMNSTLNFVGYSHGDWREYLHGRFKFCKPIIQI